MKAVTKCLFACFVGGLTGAAVRAQAPPLAAPPPLLKPEAATPLTSQPADNPAEEALSLYAELTGRTILRGSLGPGLPLFARPSSLDDINAAITSIQGQLSDRGIEIVPEGELFALAMRAGWSNSPLAAQLAGVKDGAISAARPRAAAEPASAGPRPAATADAMLPGGAFNFLGVDLNQVLLLYSELRNRTLLRSAWLACPQFNLLTRKPMLKADMIYALETLMALNRQVLECASPLALWISGPRGRRWKD
jgi:hypothetical protein